MRSRPTDREIGALIALVDAGSCNEAETKVRELLVTHPDEGILWKIFAVAQLRQGKDALAALQKAAELLPRDAEAHANLGAALHERGRWAESLQSLRVALKLNGDDVAALIHAGDCLRELGQPAEAIVVYQQALRLDRHQPEALNNLGNTLMRISRHDEAIVAYRLALELMPDSASIQFNLANAQRQAGLFEEAVVGSRRAIAMQADLAPAHNNLGLALSGLGRREEAKASFRAARAADPGNVDAAVRQVRSLMERNRFAQAIEVAESITGEAAERRDILLAMAVCQRMLSRTRDALGTLERLERIHPEFGRLHQERGYCHAAGGEAAAAAASFSRAVELNPALAASWSMLEALYRSCGQDDRARQAAAHVTGLKALPAPVLTATGSYHDGELGAAEHTIRAYLEQGGSHPEALRLLGRIALLRGAAEDARTLFERALASAPDHRDTRFDHARALMVLKRHHAARAELQKLVELEPENPGYRTLYGSACGACGDHQQAVHVYRELISSGSNAPGLRQWLGNALKALGRSEEAIEAYRAALALRPDLGIAYWSLADLKTYRFTDGETEQMLAMVDAPSTTVVDRYHFCFALGKALEDRGEYARSFEFYARGNALKRSENSYQPDPERIAARQMQTCSAAFLSSRQGVGCPSADPIFIVGLPRSGSTLLEQILASHSRVEGTKELTELPGLVLELQGRTADPSNPRYPAVLAELDPADFLRLGQRYLDETRVHRTNRPFFIDKLSGNFRHIGLIHLILPNAKIIDARREPMACCFSNFKQLFAGGQEFTYSMEELARYYRSYLDLMHHWDRVLPGRVLRVLHEDVVDDLEPSIRRILAHCGLEFEPQCLDFHRTVRSVRTASAEQVRRPIFRDGVDQWKHFEPWLGPLRAALGDALMRYRDA